MIVPNIWKNKKCINMFQTTNQMEHVPANHAMLQGKFS
jgi:hypothetical protein